MLQSQGVTTQCDVTTTQHWRWSAATLSTQKDHGNLIATILFGWCPYAKELDNEPGATAGGCLLLVTRS